MNDFDGFLSSDIGLKPQGKSAPMSASNSRSSSNSFNFDLGSGTSNFDPDAVFGSREAQKKPLGREDFGDLFGGPPKSKDNSFYFDSMFAQGSKSSSSLPVYDKPVYDDDIFEGLPGVKSFGSTSLSGKKYGDEFKSVPVPVSSPPTGKAGGSSAFDDLLGGFGKVESQSNRSSTKEDKAVPDFDDLIPGFGGSSLPSERSTRKPTWSSEPVSNTRKTTEDPFAGLGSVPPRAAPSSADPSDPLREFRNLAKSGSRKADGPSVSSGMVYDDLAYKTSDLSLLQTLPDDVFAIVSRSLSYRDICSLILSCKSINIIVDCEKVWFSQCDVLGILPSKDLIEWRKGVSSYKTLCRFLICVQPLIGIWVHQNPELGNVVYVMPGFVSVVGCRIIPQELGPLGIKDGPILWAPVFEVICDSDRSPMFLLHGREKGSDCFYPGSIKIADKNCNVLLLEVEPRLQKDGGKLMYSKSLVQYPERDLSINISRAESYTVKSRSQRVLGQNEVKVQFNSLGFSDRRKLLEIVTSQIRQQMPDSVNGPLFPRLRDEEESFKKDMAVLFERRSLLLQLSKQCGRPNATSEPEPKLPSDPTQLELSEIRKTLDRSITKPSSSNDWRASDHKRRSLYGKVKDGIKNIMGKSNHKLQKNNSFKNEHKLAQLHQFLRSGDTIGLALQASTIKLSSFRAWPNMHDSRFALYKLPLWVPDSDHEYAGLWGGTFGWPPGRQPEEKPGKALFFLMLSYEETQGERFLIATKILEGTHYVLHPNGSAMFVANIDQPSMDPFPWDWDCDGSDLVVKNAFVGEGIANGYGFRYPGAKPGSLFVTQNGLLAFVWKESRAILTLQRLNLDDLLKKGKRVPALPAIANFSYLTKSYSNVFAGFSNGSTSSASPRQRHI